MSKSNIILINIVVTFILAFSCLNASEFTTCSNCKQAFSTRSLYCTHCGAWWTSPDHIVKNEISIMTDYYKMDADGTEPAPYTIMYDTLSFGLTFRHYFNTRYQHPIVPFSFIPYNYRSDYIEFSAGLSDINYEFHELDDPGLMGNYKDSKSHEFFSLNGLYHLEKVFFGGNLAYSNLTIDDVDSDEYSDKLFAFGGSVGYHNTMAKLGLNLQYSNISRNRTYALEDNNSVSINPFIEYLPTPTMLISAGFNYLSKSSEDDNDEYAIPVQVKYVTLDDWWEFIFSFSYNDEKDGLNILDLSLEINKMFLDASVFIKPQYIRRTREDTEGEYKTTRIHFGGTHAFMSRHVMLTVSGFYGFGDSSFMFPDTDITDYRGQVTLKAFF